MDDNAIGFIELADYCANKGRAAGTSFCSTLAGLLIRLAGDFHQATIPVDLILRLYAMGLDFSECNIKSEHDDFDTSRGAEDDYAVKVLFLERDKIQNLSALLGSLGNCFNIGKRKRYIISDMECMNLVNQMSLQPESKGQCSMTCKDRKAYLVMTHFISSVIVSFLLKELSHRASWAFVQHLCEMFTDKKKHFDNDLSEDAIRDLITDACTTSAFLLEVLHASGNLKVKRIMAESLENWAAAENLFKLLPGPMPLIKQCVKIECKLYKHVDAEVIASTLCCDLLSSAKVSKRTIGKLLEQKNLFGKTRTPGTAACHQLATAYCLHALCTQEADPNSEQVYQDICAALDLWLSIFASDCCSIDDEFKMESGNSLPLLYNILDLLPMKETKSCALCLSSKWGLYDKLIEHRGERSKSIDFWINCLSGSQPGVLGFQQNLTGVMVVRSHSNVNLKSKCKMEVNESFLKLVLGVNEIHLEDTISREPIILVLDCDIQIPWMHFIFEIPAAISAACKMNSRTGLGIKAVASTRRAKMRGTTRRRPTDSFNPPVIQSSRDSDASFASSRPSSIGMGRAISVAEPYSDRSFQAATIRSINAFFSSHSIPPISTKPSQAPSAKEISNILTSLLSHLHFPCSKLEEDLGFLLKSLNCPFKFNKSTLRAPNTPHNWPTSLGIIHWLVQLAMYNEHLSQNPTTPFAQSDSMTEYALESYLRFIRGEDDLLEVLDKEFMEKLEKERENVVESSRALEKNVGELEAKAEGLRTGPTERELLEKEKNVLEEDVKKFHAIIAEFTARIGSMEKVLEEKERELNAKEEERRQICQENEELKKRVELQTFNARDVERMKREMQAVERDIGEAEVARNSWEDKSWDLDSTTRQKFKELTTLAMECNQAIRRLKLGNGFQYELNAKGSTPAEVMGIDYKATLKPELESYADKIRESSKQKFEDMILLQQQSKDMATKIEEKRNRISAIQSHIDEVEAQINLLKKEMHEYGYRSTAEAKKMVEDVQTEAQKLDIAEIEASEILKASQLRLQEAIRQSEEEIQMHAQELFVVVDSVSKYKEHVASKISEMRAGLAETAAAVADTYKGSLPAQVIGNANAS
ncbi:Kinetochore protein Ndc80 [Corchorus capsularis]|uniref:Kinetochore protein Ndc80 n=1 Tax=Corchorus capsularis TaxID=210143 RepID=A0A1R3I3H8_COCAP|nr:Kinetochore protein Ndc80 [Corchorus capsularis]